ncbi:ROK family glucokinase [Oceanobacillus halophilus]|uniref:Glucokinase n=1 Tax=Oceanobacillus halophilus TaxID=930130 RepID=A0A495ACU8_9BACI|nr:ROK family glucokinase [Oceanobacillus halophilus]RKQ37791.1 ROK family protein [Oceanobacillus halophilus]
MNEMMIGVDIGGTTVKIGFINQDGEILKKWEVPTNTSNGGKAIMDDIWKSIQGHTHSLNISKGSLLGIGIGAPGFIEPDSGFVYEAVNIGWKNMDLAKEMKERANLPVYVQNDANIAALGENWIGAGNGAKNMIAVTLGTGVGGGVIANGSILNGENGMAGEIGHIKIDPNGIPCNCGGIGCLETICSATGIKRQGIDAVSINPDSKLAKFYEEHGKLSAKDIIDFAKSGDEISVQIINNTVDILGRTLANMATIINPSKIIIGGGVSKAGVYLLDLIASSFETYAIPKLNDVCELKLAELGNDAGIIGGAYLVKQNVK